ncbi:metallophosphoesterase [Roseibacillus ishigakijimensis]|uniref:Calcineurin-like phosphoesterase domain-containing protein n=1 Tax=Roseibacillus ishigakijimensis TaxID=454146 RepID=A0A934RTQ6_9BACT|nr:metallophosphoesterase [Roseibacillus ishigakijimensis]MBK1834336.1 hypothetical protein [Roseibacillus ishigakijimensis]
MTTAAELTSGECALPLPVRLVSDWHLGHPGSAVTSRATMEPYLEGAGTLVMVGDGREELVQGWQRNADTLWLELIRLCRERGVTFIALTGNHDPGVSEEGWLKLDNGRILVTHGDMIYPTASPWSKELFKKEEEVERFLARHPARTLQERWQNARTIGRLLRPDARMAPSFFGYLKLAFWPPRRLLEVVKVWASFPRASAEFLSAHAPEAQELVCGHFHRAGRFRVGERVIWNTGSRMKYCRPWVLDFDGQSLKRVR